MVKGSSAHVQRRIVVETGMSHRYNNSNGEPPAAKLPDWRRIEQKKRGAIVAEVSQRPLHIPLYSVRIGVSIDDENGQVLDVRPHMSIYMPDDAMPCLADVYTKYTQMRERAIQESENYGYTRARRYAPACQSLEEAMAQLKPSQRLVYPANPRDYNWQLIEQRICNTVVVEVSQRNMRVPQFSIRIGVARLDDDGEVAEVLPYMNIYLIPAAYKLLGEVRDEFIPIREQFLKENENYMASRRQRTNVASGNGEAYAQPQQGSRPGLHAAPFRRQR